MEGAQLIQVTKKFGAVEILKGIDLTIQPREFTVFLGPSGCGKSTTLRLLAGLERQTSGEIWIAGRNVSDLEPRQRDVAMVFQNYALYPNMTIAENMGFGLKARNMPKAEIADRVEKVARLLSLSDLLDRKPKQLSGGQQQRVAIGRAIVRNPNLFLFDEPLSNLDAKLRVEMRTELLRLHRELGATTVYVTHDQEEAMTMADRIVVMNGGQIEQMGTPADIFFRPASVMVAGFVGSPSMNFLQGTVADGRLVTELGAFGIATGGLPEKSPVTMGLRPDDFYFPEDLAGEETAGTIDFLVEFVELLGARGIVTLRKSGIVMKGVFEERFLQRLQEGSEVRLAVSRNRLHLFDGVEGTRLGDAV
ncbi:sn-glycerol-3-phosphate ABC transporter ATP-binding protein UgpC [Pelagibius sp. CAU 1746]|uniref:ABC transporter ATP-binding protein n=1 Tax=Pelagibius sp. CAU 1746 TaxID=3140370 RepID=UPI00325BE1F3